MGHRFVDLRTIQQRMAKRDTRINRELARRVAAAKGHIVTGGHLRELAPELTPPLPTPERVE